MRIRCLLVIALILTTANAANAEFYLQSKTSKGGTGGPQMVRVQDGSTVHNVGELHMHVGNWGIFGSWPGIGLPYSDAPSAQWPGGSGIEYLFAAGLWVGALKNGIPAVSTAAFEDEFYPTGDARDIMYTSAEGRRGGNRLPSPDADDDRDGQVDEDWLNGRDDDFDGEIDEDYAAVSTQMFSCWYTDDQPVSITRFPQHNPLNITVRQESYQWEEDRFDDFVGIQYRIMNTGNEILEDIFVGFFADCDVGPRDGDDIAQDDLTARTFIPAICTDIGPVQVDVAYMYDDDGDNGQATGYFGVMFLGHTTDPTGEVAPQRVGISTYANFSGTQDFDQGGDPRTDIQRYDLLSQQLIERDAQVPRDYRMLVSAGPFSVLEPGEELVFQVAFAIGEGFEGLARNASNAQLTFDGAWFNLDGDRFTGVNGQETPVVGPAENVFVDTCSAPGAPPVVVPRGETLWINNDCAREEILRTRCGYTEAEAHLFRTGVDGKETHINWIIGTPPPPPNLRIDDHSNKGIVVYWDNYSETVPDVKTQEEDFEGYRVWRADNWTRPVGTTAASGPSSDLWKMLFKADIVNGWGDDTGIERYRYEPLTSILTPSQKDNYITMIKEYMAEFPNSTPPCPQGVDDAVCDTLTALAKWETGDEDGRQYYCYVDDSIHLGRPYFYAVTAEDHGFTPTRELTVGKAGDPASNFVFVEPKAAAQPAYSYREGDIYVVPNPATTESMAAWALKPEQRRPDRHQGRVSQPAALDGIDSDLYGRGRPGRDNSLRRIGRCWHGEVGSGEPQRSGHHQRHLSVLGRNGG